MKRGPNDPIILLRATGDALWLWQYTKLPDHERIPFFQACIDKCDLLEPQRTIWIKAMEVVRDHGRKELIKIAGDRFTLKNAFTWTKEKEKQKIKSAERRAKQKAAS